MKRFVGIIFAIIMLFSVVTSAQSPEVTVLLDGKKIEFDVPAQIIESNTMVPLRAIFEALGADVTWDDTTKTVSSSKGDTKVSLTIGQKIIKVNGTEKPLLVAPVIIDSRTLVPVRAISESYGCKVGWIDETKTVTIEMPKTTGTEPGIVKEILLQDGYSNENGLFANNGALSISTDPSDANNSVFKISSISKLKLKTYVRQNMEFIPGHVYTFSFDAKAVENVEGQQKLSVYYKHGSYENVMMTTNIFADKWRKINGSFQIPENYTPKAKSDIFGVYSAPTAKSGVSFMIDNLVLTHEPMLSEEEKDVKIILLQGDSITDTQRVRNQFWDLGVGYASVVGKTMAEKYPNEYKIVNKGIYGNRLTDVNNRINDDIIGISPDYMSIMIGVNDVWIKYNQNAKLDLVSFEKMYCNMIEKIKNEVPDIKIMLIEPYVLMGSSTKDNYDAFRADIVEMGKIVKKIAEKYDLAFLPLMSILEKEAEGKAQGYLSGDGVHPSNAGRDIIAREWLKAFEENFIK